MPDYSGYSLVEEEPKAELVDKPNAANIVPDMDVHDPVTYGSLTADHALRQLHAQGIPVNFDQYVKIQDDAMGKAMEYQAHQREMVKSKALEEYYKKQELQPGGIEEQKAALAARAEETKKQLEQGPSATAVAAQQGNLPGGQHPGLIKAPSDQQQKDWSAYTEGFHNLQDLHTLFDNMATKTAGAGGAIGSLGGLTTKLTDLTSSEARTYHAYVDSSLIPLAKSIMGDAATTAGKETVQGAMTEALPTNVDNLQSGGQKMFMFYKRALDKMQTERDMARRNGVDTSSIDTTLNDFHSFFNSDQVQKYNPLKSQPLIQSGNSPEGRLAMTQVQNAANAGTIPIQYPNVYNPMPSPTAVPQTQAPQTVYPQIASDVGGGQVAGTQPGIAIGRLQGLLPKQGGSQDPNLVMPPGSQGQATWGQ